MERLRSALACDVNEALFATVLARVIVAVDSPVVRARLARALVAARDAGAIPFDVAAYTLVDLPQAPSAMLAASVLQSTAVSARVTQTPAGLVVAHR